MAGQRLHTDEVGQRVELATQALGLAHEAFHHLAEVVSESWRRDILPFATLLQGLRESIQGDYQSYRAAHEDAPAEPDLGALGTCPLCGHAG
jgi:hypothetical protein